MNPLIKAIEGFISHSNMTHVCPKTEVHYSNGALKVVGKRSECNTHWASIEITPEPKPLHEDAKISLMDAKTTVRAVVENEDARTLILTAIKRVYDAASK